LNIRGEGHVELWPLWGWDKRSGLFLGELEQVQEKAGCRPARFPCSPFDLEFFLHCHLDLNRSISQGFGLKRREFDFVHDVLLVYASVILYSSHLDA
jgi:hypothetical protein